MELEFGSLWKRWVVKWIESGQHASKFIYEYVEAYDSGQTLENCTRSPDMNMLSATRIRGRAEDVLFSRQALILAPITA